MKHLYTMKYLLIVCLLLQSANVLAHRDSDRRYYSSDCCPLPPCSFGIGFHAGIYPIIWRDRGDSSLVVTDNIISETATVGIPKFSHLYKLPWVVGARLSYAFCCNSDVYLEFNYAQANNKCNLCSGIGNLIIPNLFINLRKYKLFSGYIGLHYYMDNCWCSDWGNFFIAAKIGLVRHKRTEFQLLTSTTAATDYLDRTFFESRTVASGGVGLGLDIDAWCNWNLIFTAEVVVSGGPRTRDSIILSTDDAFLLNTQRLLLHRIGTEIAFPITIGFKYTF